LSALLLGANDENLRVNVGGLSLAPFKMAQQEGQFDLSLEFIEVRNSLSACLIYSTDRFDKATIIRMVGHFNTLLESIATNPEQQVDELPLLTAAEQHQLLVDWNDTAVDYPVEKCIHQLFEAQVERTPEAIAVVFGNQQLTYRALNTKANQLAHHLQTLGVKPEVLVGICIERSVKMIIGLLGILKAGGAYLPLDPTYPVARLTFMLEDALVLVLLTQSSLKEKLSSHQASFVCLESNWDIISRLGSDNMDSGVKPDNLAYVIYTSGSTGKPKGVMVQHQSLVNFIETAIVEYGLTPCDRVLQFASISFDAAAEEIYPCLTCGGLLVLRSDEMLNSVPFFLQNCRELELTVLDLPTAFWHQVTSELVTNQLVLPNSLRLVIIGGERARSDVVGFWQKWVGTYPQLVNTYGPTEATVVATIYPLPRSTVLEREWRDIPIGRAIHNVQTYVLDKYLQPLPLGVPGELHLGGVCLARGYLNRLELTNEKFIPNPFSDGPSSRLYKTGDLVRYLPDGHIEYLGRVDNQVKIRGFRIELSEIEAVLAQHPDVQESVVIAQEDKPGNMRLVAYIVSNFMPERIPYQSICLAELDGKTIKLRTEEISKSGVSLVEIPAALSKGQHIRLYLQLPGEEKKQWLNGIVRWSHGAQAGIQFQLTPTEQTIVDQSVEHSQQGFLKVLQRTVTTNLQNYLKKKLPDYMVPYRFVLVEALPLTPNGKIDHRALEQLSVNNYPLSEVKFAEPRTPEEELLIGIWADVLGVFQIGIHDDFFELGGHSLLATQLISRIHEIFSIALPLRNLFESPTVAGIAQTINQIRQAGTDVVVATNTIIDFNAEAVLEPTIQPPSTIPVEGLLLTGATGFLGAYLLYELLAQTTADIYCLVRSPNANEGKKILQNKLESCSLWHESFNSRIIPIIGNLYQPLLGLSDSLFHLLASQIEAIYHSGAMVNFVYPYSKLKATNVLGTQEILKLASQIKAKPVHFISTLSVFADSGARIVRESDIDDIQALDDGYSQSKWVAEKLVMQACDRGLPVCIYRPSRIIGHSQTGISNLNDLFTRGIKGCIQLGLLPPIDEITDNMVPVDYVSRAI
ncbi:MAG TPA: amino acid adenylation domain-containing protein, partial [Thioploca sp.]|nr:amino acid adenylation domain-containing protein [Thioploca sp.]